MADTRPMVRHAVRIIGSQAKLARGLGISQARVCQLCKQVERCSAEVAVGIDRLTDGVIPAWHTRPDLFAMPEGAVMPPPDFHEPPRVCA